MVKKEEMDILYFKKYCKYVKQNAGTKSAMNLFLTLKKCRKSCYILFHMRYEKSFLHILHYYKMYYEMKKHGNHIECILSSHPIAENVKYVFHHSDEDVKHPQIMGKFLEYPSFINIRKVSTMKEVGSIQFRFYKNSTDRKKDKNAELIYGFRIPNTKISPERMIQMNTLLKKYRKCIQNHLGILYPEFTIELNIKLNP